MYDVWESGSLEVVPQCVATARTGSRTDYLAQHWPYNSYKDDTPEYGGRLVACVWRILLLWWKCASG